MVEGNRTVQACQAEFRAAAMDRIAGNRRQGIAVDTSVAHLAGALAKPVWVLLPFIPDWRWLLDRDDSPWYPTARLFRQDDSRQWDGAFGRLRAALDDFLHRQ
jgi:hypothetical protein